MEERFNKFWCIGICKNGSNYKHIFSGHITYAVDWLTKAEAWANLRYSISNDKGRYVYFIRQKDAQNYLDNMNEMAVRLCLVDQETGRPIDEAFDEGRNQKVTRSRKKSLDP